MKRLATFAALLVGSFAVVGCTAPDSDVIRVLEDQGMSDIKLTGHRFIGCGKEDTTSDGFEATAMSGRRVSGVVCGSFGWGKSYTVRYD